MSYTDDFRQFEIPLKDILASTNNFNDKPIGTGGFGDVYKGELLLPKGLKMVAFKRLNRKCGQGDVEFWKEIIMLTQLKHKNLATLLGFCREGDERILVYKYASRGSLDYYLDRPDFSWLERLKLLIGAANGIAYLHDPRKTQQRVLHRDIKSSNILVNGKGTAKLSDFGLSKMGPANLPRTYLVSNVVGTPGYCDPEYHYTGILSKECDVYSFGVVLLEVLCGRLCCEYNKGKLICILVQTWKNRCDEDRVHEIIFPDLKKQIHQESLSTFVDIAMRCLDRDPKKRPNMVEVLKELEVALHQQLNPKQNEVSVVKTPTFCGLKEEFDHLKISLKDIELATNNFCNDNIIGRGGYGRVYRGEISLPGGQSMVSFKRLDRRLGHGDAELWKDILLHSEYKHENIVSLLGFCREGDELILVYSYASHGCLDSYLSEPSLTWTQRLKISLGVARAINYLHELRPETQSVVLHRDIKSANILLGANWEAKIYDFGLSSFTSTNLPQTPLTSPVGTIGYCDPLYFQTGFLSKESDVYSFGVVLFELLCGRLSTEYRNGGLALLVPKWLRCYDEKRLDEIICHELVQQLGVSSLNTFSSIAYQCLKNAREERPTMAAVVKELEIALEQQKDFEEKFRNESRVMPPIFNTSQIQNCMVYPEGVLVEDGNTWLSQLKNGKVCEVISATKCIYAESLEHDNTQNSRFSNVIKGGMYNGFRVKVTSQFLSPEAMYSVSLVFKHNGTGDGTHIPFKFKVDEKTGYTNSCMTRVRDDGWLTIQLCEFTSDKREYDLGFHFLPLFNITSSSIQYIFEGIEFQPVEYVC